MFDVCLGLFQTNTCSICFVVETVSILSTSQRNNKKLLFISSTTLSISLVFGGIIGGIILWKYRANALALREIQQGFGGIIGGIILWKYRANALALREIQQGIFLFIYYSFVSIVYIIISCHHDLNIIFNG